MQRHRTKAETISQLAEGIRQMSKRNLRIAMFVMVGIALIAALVVSFSRPAPVHVSVRFAGYTVVQSPFTPPRINVRPTDASFSVTNAGRSKIRLRFCFYQVNDNNHIVFIKPSGLGTLCALKPGESTNLVLPMVPIITGAGRIQRADDWRVELSSRYDWLTKLNRQPGWVQRVITKALPRSWMTGLYRGEIVSDWITNREATPDYTKMVDFSQPTNANRPVP